MFYKTTVVMSEVEMHHFVLLDWIKVAELWELMQDVSGIMF